MSDTVAAKTLTGIAINGIVVMDTIPAVCPTCGIDLIVCVAYNPNDEIPRYAIRCPKCGQVSIGLVAWEVQ